MGDVDRLQLAVDSSNRITWLGRPVAFNGLPLSVSDVSAKPWKAYWKLQDVWLSRALSLICKLVVLDRCVLPCLQCVAVSCCLDAPALMQIRNLKRRMVLGILRMRRRPDESGEAWGRRSNKAVSAWCAHTKDWGGRRA